MINSPASKTSIKSSVWVVAACLNEEDVICQFIERVTSISEVTRLVLVDDGSSDSTVSKILNFPKSFPNVKGYSKVTLLELTRNFGKEAAMLAGLDYVKGRCSAVVTIDSDLQHPPELISEMVRQWENGAEVVTAVRDDRDEESRLKVASATWFYKVFNQLVESIQLKEGAGDFRLLNSPVIEALTNMREFSRFSKGLLPWTGYHSIDINYKRINRIGGRSSWSPFKLWGYALDGIFSFSVIPLKVWTLIGITVSTLSIFYALLIVLRTALNGIDVPGYASLMVAVLFLGGIQLIGVGVLGDYIGRIYVDTKARPHYFIRAIHLND